MEIRKRLLGRRSKAPPGGPAARSTEWIHQETPPPACPPGWLTGPPDFVGVGAQKAGTTWWFRLIASHPDVHQDPDQRPELHFFDRFHARWPTDQDIERYHRHFPRPPGGLAGEKTPGYMSDYWVPRMLREAAPDTRIIILLRDPIERYRSARTHGLLSGWPDDRRTESDTFHKGLYVPQLQRLADEFSTAQTLTLQYERCVADPAGQLARTYRFLGLRDHALNEEELRRPRNETRAAKATMEPERRAVLRDLYEPDVRALTGPVPDLDLSLWPNFSDLAET